MTAHELQVASAEATYHGQTVKLLSPAKLSFADGLSITGLKLGAQTAVLEVDGRVSPTLDVHAALRELKPELINAFMPSLLASGTIKANAEIQGTFAAPVGNIHAEAIGIRSANDAARGLPPVDVHAGAQLMGNTALLDVKLSAGAASQTGTDRPRPSRPGRRAGPETRRQPRRGIAQSAVGSERAPRGGRT